MSIPKLGYWDIQGLGQAIRMLLTYLDIEYEDIVYDNTIRSTTWMNEIKPNLGLDFPNLPYYKDGDLKLTQSLAIIRYLGKKNGMYGKTAEESAKIDMLMEFGLDLVRGLVLGLAFKPDFVRFVIWLLKSLFFTFLNLQEKLKAGYIQKAEGEMKKLSDFLGNKKYFMGDNLTIADFQLRDPINWHRTLDENLIKKFPNLLSYLDRFEEQPKIKEFLNGPKHFKHFFLSIATWRGVWKIQ